MIVSCDILKIYFLSTTSEEIYLHYFVFASFKNGALLCCRMNLFCVDKMYSIISNEAIYREVFSNVFLLSPP